MPPLHPCLHPAAALHATDKVKGCKISPHNWIHYNYTCTGLCKIVLSLPVLPPIFSSFSPSVFILQDGFLFMLSPCYHPDKGSYQSLWDRTSRSNMLLWPIKTPSLFHPTHSNTTCTVYITVLEVYYASRAVDCNCCLFNILECDVEATYIIF